MRVQRICYISNTIISCIETSEYTFRYIPVYYILGKILEEVVKDISTISRDNFSNTTFIL